MDAIGSAIDADRKDVGRALTARRMYLRSGRRRIRWDCFALKSVLRQSRVEDFALIGGVAVAIERDLIGRIAIHIEGHGWDIGLRNAEKSPPTSACVGTVDSCGSAWRMRRPS